MSSRRRAALTGTLAVAVVLATGVAGGAALSAADGGSTVEPGAVGTTLQNGTVGTVSVDAAFVGAVTDAGTMSVTASGIVDSGGEPVDGEQVTVTVGGDPVTTVTVENGTLVATVEPSVLDLEPQDGAEVGVHGFESTDPATVDIVHEVVALAEGYNLHSVPQPADLVVSDVAAVNAWDPVTGSYESVTDPSFETADDLNRALSLVATSDDARLGYTFETDQAPTPGVEAFGPGWNFVGSNFDISAETDTTVQTDLVGIDAGAHDVFAGDLSEQLAPDDTVGPYDGYWVFADGADLERATLAPMYDSADREDALGIEGSDFQFTGVDIETSETGNGGVVEVTATVENQGDSPDTQFVDLLAENSTGGFETVGWTGLELDPGSSKPVTTTYEVNETTQFDVTVATDDDETTETVTWGDGSVAVSGLSTPGRSHEGQSVTVGNTGFTTGTQDLLFGADHTDSFGATALVSPTLVESSHRPQPRDSCAD